MEKLAEKFNKSYLGELKKNLSLKNVWSVPRVEKVVITAGVGDFKEDQKAVESIQNELAHICGQKPRIDLSRKAVSAFKLRIGQPVGMSATLRRVRMFDFIDKLVNVALPRVRDFRGLSLGAFDGHGNYSIGVKDYAIFPEVKYEDITTNFGFQINIKTTAKNDENARILLEVLGFPFEKLSNRKTKEK